jgi:murein DD-endopeptidase MepM/ murein hydrolase activator NlpD
MKIILVPDSASRKSRCLKNRSMVLAILVFAFLIPIAGAIGAYKLGESQANYQPGPGQLRLAYVQKTLENSRQDLKDAERAVEQQLDTLGRRLGKVQARVQRLDALGKRLTSMAELETSEFNFDTDPGMGGPAPVMDEQPVTELMAALDSLQHAVDMKKDELEILEALLIDRNLQINQHPNGWPVQDGWLSSGFGYRNDPFSGKRAFHSGVDIASKTGVPIKVVAAGVVTTARTKPGYGVTVEINHGKGYSTRYAHALEAMVKVGDRVEKGDVVATVGNTGRSTGAHLHFEVLRDGESVNPRKYLRASM